MCQNVGSKTTFLFNIHLNKDFVVKNKEDAKNIYYLRNTKLMNS